MADAPNTKAIQAALLAAMESTMRRAVEDLVARAVPAAPVDEGPLRASALPTVEVHGNQVIGRVTFGMPYAAAQHEGMDFVHPKGGGAKFLEGPLKAMEPEYMDALAKAARRAIQNGN